ncbi:MAG: hypothetical protein FD124_308 [Alphaproteobacteria bacterium]|nr:MAG: hypothetical protein FD160_254 [Caulobacteraceae bacterium]TPW08566.1 MAG: hypothetical protein FD124_308 [Alphaproteobacteria bacterium]
MLMLREPTPAYGLAGLVMLYAVGLMVVVWALAGFGQIDFTAAGPLALPAGAATAATALAVGPRLQAYKIKTRVVYLASVGAVWAFFGAAWPTAQAFEDAAVAGAQMGVEAMMFQAAVGAAIGAVAGVIGGAAAMVMCIDGGR